MCMCICCTEDKKGGVDRSSTVIAKEPEGNLHLHSNQNVRCFVFSLFFVSVVVDNFFVILKFFLVISFDCVCWQRLISRSAVVTIEEPAGIREAIF